MFGLFDAMKVAAGMLVGVAAAVLWAVVIYGPNQYDAGGAAKAAQLDAATNAALEDLANEADRGRFLRRQCLERGGVYSVSAGRCLERAPE